MPKRPRAHNVDRRAKEIFEKALPETLIPRDQVSDYGIDYLVEIFENRQSLEFTEPTGVNFAVQLKGTQSARVSRSAASVPIEVDHLIYYVDECRVPVFLVLVETSTMRVFWLCLQIYALGELKENEWRKRKTITIRIPLTQTLVDTKAFEDYARKAERIVAAHHPVAVQAALKADRARLEALDPRFHITVLATESNKEYSLYAKEPVPITFNFKGPREKLAPKLHDLIGRGLPVEFSRTEVEAEGSDLFKKILNKGAVIQMAPKLSCQLHMSGLDPKGERIGQEVIVPGILTGGTREFRFDGRLEDAPLRIRFAGPMVATGKPEFSFRFAAEAWKEQKLLRLAYFDAISSLFQALRVGSSVRVVLLDHGNRLISATGRSRDLAPVLEIANFLEIVRKARKVAADYHVNPSFPDSWGPETTSQIQDVFYILENLGSPKSGSSTSMSATISKEAIPRLLETTTGKAESGTDFKVVREEEYLHFLDTDIRTGKLEIILTRATLRPQQDELRGALEKEGESIAIEWCGTEKSLLTIKALATEKGAGA